jgi:hypothetical protein
MTKEEIKKLDAQFAEITKHERDFLNRECIEPNEHGAYIFKNFDDTASIALDIFLLSYKQWLIENKIVKEL